jgi:tetratricopeptide (TPR) repeat protein
LALETLVPFESAKKSGKAKMQITTKSSFLVTEFSSRKFVEIPTVQNWHTLYQHLGVSLLLNSANAEVMAHLGNQLMAIAEHAYPIHDNETLKEAARLLMTLPLSGEFRTAGNYYMGLYAVRQGSHEQARSIFENVIRLAAPDLKARALVSFGSVYQSEGDLESALRISFDAANAASLNDCRSPVPFVMAMTNIAIIHSVQGDGRQALEALESIYPLAQLIGHHYPQQYYTYFNRLAVELGEAGRFEEAANVINRVLRSPIARAYPAWFETRQEIIEKAGRASRSRVVILRTRLRKRTDRENILYLADSNHRRRVEPEASSNLDIQQRTGRVLKFRKAKKPTAFEALRQADPSQLNRKQKIIRIVDLITGDLSNEKLDKILNSVIIIASGPS